MDFSEKYALIAQDSTQGFYFKIHTATVQPIEMYYKDPETNKEGVQSFSVISNCSKQTASTIKIFLKQFINVIKARTMEKLKSSLEKAPLRSGGWIRN